MPIRKYHTKWFKHMFSIGGNKSRLSLNAYFSHIQTLLLAASQLESNWPAATWKKKNSPHPWVLLLGNIILGTVASLLSGKINNKLSSCSSKFPVFFLWYLFDSSCARRSMFLCNSCFQQGSEYMQVIMNWFPWILIHNQCSQEANFKKVIF